MSGYVIEMLGITKAFHGTVANDNITLKVKKGEIHALTGENAAGKSTLMSVLFGLYKADKGEILKSGRRVTIKNPHDAAKLGIGMVHQHFKLIEAFTVLDNIILGSEDTCFGFIKKAKARSKITELCEKYSLILDLDAEIENLTVGMQQKTEILKMLYRESEIFIFDEPTAVLTENETKSLIQIMKRLRDEGKSVIFITHKLDEVMEAADRVTVLRKGKCIGTVKIADTDKDSLCAMMMGKSLEEKIKKRQTAFEETVLRVEGISVASALHKKRLAVKDVSFSIKKGEILSVFGIDGNGQRELTGGITGSDKICNGRIYIENNDITHISVRKRNLSFISHIPEDRQGQGLVTGFTLMDNLVLKRYFEHPFQRYGFRNIKSIYNYAAKLIDKYAIMCAYGPFTPTDNISGGNQQKAVIARELDRAKPLIIAVQPTRGLDINATHFIHSQLIQKRDEGHAILLISLDLDEVMRLSDKIIIIHQGEIKAELTPESTSRHEIGLYMSGVKKGGMQHEN